MSDGFEIDKGIPVPRRYVGRKSKYRDAMLKTMREMKAGDSFRVEYKLPSLRNFLRTLGDEVPGSYRGVQETDSHCRVWRTS